MQVQLVNINKLKNNTGQIEGLPKNPRLLKDDKFKKLVKSIQDDPEMLELREVIAYDNNGELVVIAGNMRLKACQEVGLKEIPTKILPQHTPVEKLKAYTIKDNVAFGEHNWDDLANNWDAEKITEWGLDIPNWTQGHEINSMSEDELDLNEEFDAIGLSKNLQKVVFVFDGAEDAESWLKQFPSLEIKKNSQVWQINLNTPFT